MPGPDPARVAQLVVTPAVPRDRRLGSGYLVSSTIVLTAAHVVRDAAAVEVRLPGRAYAGKVIWCEPETTDTERSDARVDAALVAIAMEGAEPVGPALFGRISGTAEVLPCTLAGFPLFKLRGRQFRFRDSVAVTGRIRPLSNRQEMTWEIVVDDPPGDYAGADGPSPWEGMSGAPVWCQGRIVGIVSQNHRAEGAGRLTATRTELWHTLIGQEGLGRLCGLLGLPADVRDIPDVSPRPAEQLTFDTYREQARRFAPRGDLVGRDAETAQLTDFCFGHEPYLWWQAPPWSGKTTLMAWFCLHPPAGVTIVSFFVRSNSIDFADSGHFRNAMIEQLAAVAGEDVPDPWARDVRMEVLLRKAAQRRKPILIVVDGLDEDLSGDYDQPSIASQLPMVVPEGVHVVVTSRAYPDVLEDVPEGHPLRHCRPRPLAPSSYAQGIEREAKRELDVALRAGLSRRIIALLAAGRGGLALAEIAELTRRDVYDVEAAVSGVLGRSLVRLHLRDQLSPGPPDATLEFAHQTLMEMAIGQLARDLPRYRQHIHDWAQWYRDAGWPENTPHYLLTAYSRMLSLNRGETGRLVGLVTDRARHERMIRRSHTDAAAMAEIAAVRSVLTTGRDEDLVALSIIALEYDRLVPRNSRIPAGLPAVWAQLGQPDLADALARSLPNAHRRASAMTDVAREVARRDPARGRAIVEFFKDPYDRAETLAAVGAGAAATDRGAADRAFREAKEILERIVTSRHYDQDRYYGTAVAVAKDLAVLDLEAAINYVVTAAYPPDAKLAAVVALLEAAVAARREPLALWLADFMEEVLRQVTALDAFERNYWFSSVASAVATVDPERAERIVAHDLTVTDNMFGNPAVTALQVAAALAGVPGQEQRVARLAERAERGAAGLGAPDLVIAEARALVDLDGGLRFALGLEDPERRDTALAQIIEGAVSRDVSRASWALELAQLVDDDYDRARVLHEIAAEVGRRYPHQYELAEQAARAITPLEERARALTSLAAAVASHDGGRATRLAVLAEQTARLDADDFGQHQRTLAVITESTAPVDVGRARRCAMAIERTDWQMIGLAAVVEAMADSDPAQARRLARRLAGVALLSGADPDLWIVLTKAVSCLKRRYVRGLASRAARAVRAGSDESQVREFVALAKAVAPADPKLAEQLIDEAAAAAAKLGQPDRQARAYAMLAEVLAPTSPETAVKLIRPLEELADRPQDEFQYADNGPGEAEENEDMMDLALMFSASREWFEIGGHPWEATTLAAVAGALPPVDGYRRKARQLADRAEHMAWAASRPDARALALAVLAEALTDIDAGRARRLATQAAETLANIRTVTSATAAVHITRVAVKLSDPHRPDDLVGIARRALAQSLAGKCWLNALPAVPLLTPAGIQDVCDAAMLSASPAPS